jgi:ADP-ribose pyrophosphatase YjhB (NUDIX family)
VTIPDAYTGRVRVRVGALLFDNPDRPGAVLLAEHEGLWEDRPFWTPPGGGVEFGEGLEEALRREVAEETGVDVEVGPLRYTLDFVRPPLHAVSFYFACHLADPTSGGVEAARLGTDPELGDHQLLRSLRLVPFEELGEIVLYPEPFAARLAADARAGFPDGAVYLGTFR